MLEFTLPPPSDEILFEAVLEPTAAVIKKLGKKEEMGEGELTTFLGKVNKVAVGMPYCENLISRYAEQAMDLPHEIRKMMDKYDFHFVSLSCSFLPDTNCKFIWARFGIELSAQKESGELSEKPIAHDMFPDEVLSEMKYKREVSFNPRLNVRLGVIDTDAAIDVKTEKELTVYVPQIFAFGINRPNVAWDFKSTEEKGIWGNKRDLLLIVRARKNSKIKGRFLLGAEVEFNVGKWISIPLSKRKDNVVNIEYGLSDEVVEWTK
ncbi:MAG: hypothetical protein HXS48_16220 [Theionarchaea archaeon]|nr:hypothetical protein [Theionarchaea archaeon]